MTQTGPYGHSCAILQAHQQKNPQNPFKTIKPNHSDQEWQTTLDRFMLFFVDFFPQQGCQKHSHMVVVRAFI